jgi:hypothetical protein
VVAMLIAMQVIMAVIVGLTWTQGNSYSGSGRPVR